MTYILAALSGPLVEVQKHEEDNGKPGKQKAWRAFPFGEP
jgi:hypothetical protein